MKSTNLLIGLVLLVTTLETPMAGDVALKKASESNQFISSLNQIENSNEILKLLDEEADQQRARQIIYRLYDVDKRAALIRFNKLWQEGDDSSPQYNNKYGNPISRLTIAEILLKHTGKTEYGNYIKINAKHGDWIVQSIAAETLKYVDDPEVIKLLEEIIIDKNAINTFPAVAAVESLSQISRYGEQSKLAEKAIISLYKDRYMFRERVEEALIIAYQEIGRTEESNDSNITGHSNDSISDSLINDLLQKERYSEAIDLLLADAEKGDEQAQYLIGELYQRVSPPDYNSALKWITIAVEQGYAPAKVSMANMYISGRGVNKNYSEAVRLLLEAEEQGNRTAKEMLEMAKRNGWWGL